MTTITVPALVAVLGLVVYFASAGKPSTAGLVAFAAGLLVALEGVARVATHIP